MMKLATVVAAVGSIVVLLLTVSPASAQWRYLGRLSGNPYGAQSTANPYGDYGSPYSSSSTTNPYNTYGSPYSQYSWRNRYTSSAPILVGQDGQYLGRLSSNRYDPDSISNPYGRYGSPYSSTSINNPYSQYGSPYSNLSPHNPYCTSGPLIIAPDIGY